MCESLEPRSLTFRGIGVSPGFVTGPVYCLPAEDVECDIETYIAPSQIPGELQRLEAAFDDAVSELRMLQEIAEAHDLGNVTLDVLTVHQMLLEDHALRKNVQQRICNQLLSPELAVREAIESVIQLTCSSSPFWKARESDFRDIQERLLGHLSGRAQAIDLSHVKPNSILVARELLPCHMIALATECIKAVVTEDGSPTSHVTIIARSWGIPAVVGATGICAAVATGDTLTVDGCSGHLDVLSDEAMESEVFAMEGGCEQPSVTMDGGVLTEVTLLGNVNRSEDLSMLAPLKLQGVGLCRTEFFYLHSLMPPSMAQQKRDYAEAANRTAPHEVVIRTFDFSPEKWPIFWGKRSAHLIESERSCLLNEQLEALLRCYRSKGNMAIMFPMIHSLKQLETHLESIERIATRIKLDSLPMIGAMIETLGALEQLPEIVSRVDFVSIGSNDLASELLGVERTGATLQDSRRWLMEPRLLRVVEQIVETARAANCPLSLCGEAAGDPILAALFVGIGVRRLSFSPSRTREVRRALCSISADEARNVARHALAADSLSAVIGALVHYLPDEILHIVSNHRWAWPTSSNGTPHGSKDLGDCRRKRHIRVS